MGCPVNSEVQPNSYQVGTQGPDPAHKCVLFGFLYDLVFIVGLVTNTLQITKCVMKTLISDFGKHHEVTVLPQNSWAN